MQRLADSLSVGQDLKDPPNEFCAVLSGAGATHGAFDDRRKMARDYQRLLGLVNSPELGLQAVLLLKLPIELVRQQRLVYPPVHEPDVSGSQAPFKKFSPTSRDPTAGSRGRRLDRPRNRPDTPAGTQRTTGSRITEFCGGFVTTLA